MTRDEAIAFLDQPSGNDYRPGSMNPMPQRWNAEAAMDYRPGSMNPVPPRWMPPTPRDENALQYWSRSPLVQDVGQNVSAGVHRVGERLANAATIAGAAAALPPYLMNRMQQRLVYDPAVAAAGAVGGAANRAIDWAGGKIGTALGTAAGWANQNVVRPVSNWFQSRVIPPPIARPQTQSDYEALPSGTYYIEPETGETKRKS